VSDVTRILGAMERGDQKATDQLLPLVYDALRKLAAQKMADEPAGHTLQPTALVHEAYLRLLGQQAQAWQNSRHFFSAAAEAIRRILVERARKKGRLRHGGP
jgi:RNA polymerase sigma factor (TIGR02999 family)